MSALPNTNEYLITLYEIQEPFNRVITNEDANKYVSNNWENLSLSDMVANNDYDKFFIEILDYATVLDARGHNPSTQRDYEVKDICLICKVLNRMSLILPIEDSLIEGIYTENVYLNKIKNRYKRNDKLNSFKIPVFNHKVFLKIEKLENVVDDTHLVPAE